MVGPEKEEFDAHHELLCQHSPWFRNRLNGKWGDQKRVEIDDDPEVFGLFLGFIYRGQLDAPHFSGSSSATKVEQNEPSSTKKQKVSCTRDQHHTTLKLAKLYIFADYHQCQQLKIAAMDALRDRVLKLWEISLPREVVNLVFEDTADGCGLRRFIADVATKTSVRDKYWASDIAIREVKNQLHPEFLADIAILLYKWRVNPGTCMGQEEWLASNPCDYHDHKEDDTIEAQGATTPQDTSPGN